METTNCPGNGKLSWAQTSNAEMSPFSYRFGPGYPRSYVVQGCHLYIIIERQTRPSDSAETVSGINQCWSFIATTAIRSRNCCLWGNILSSWSQKKHLHGRRYQYGLLYHHIEITNFVVNCSYEEQKKFTDRQKRPIFRGDRFIFISLIII